MSCEPWLCAEIASTKKANPIQKPEIAVAMIKRAQRPLLIVGSQIVDRWMEGKQAIEYIIELANASKIQVVATAHMVREFINRGYTPAAYMNAMEISQRVGDPAWMGLDGKGRPDLVIYVGMPYYMEALILSGLKHFAPDLKTMTIDNMYHVHASWSFPNASLEEWASNLKVMTSKFNEGGN
ncbi:MAG: CO dehydrogenase/acetyl-CoA synthase complex subunit epsilon [Nitrososphaerota archaeon]|jgi:acetyl-CoA decarbonylase/synthase complex subunit epsilon|nr:CO dehydrogenase/acetyl-CoA synthase complex subunit epsilon [Nitrososphaerota archaeon]